jgi:hypothetical protein
LKTNFTLLVLISTLSLCYIQPSSPFHLLFFSQSRQALVLHLLSKLIIASLPSPCPVCLRSR